MHLLPFLLHPRPQLRWAFNYYTFHSTLNCEDQAWGWGGCVKVLFSAYFVHVLYLLTRNRSLHTAMSSDLSTRLNGVNMWHEHGMGLLRCLILQLPFAKSWRRVFLRSWRLQNFKLDILRSVAMLRGGLRNQQTVSLCMTATERGIQSPFGAFV